MASRQQRLKWTVYALLFLDFILYLYQDAEAAHYVLGAAPGFLDYAAAYVTSIDLAAWFALILLFELETYVMADRSWTGGQRWAAQGLRLVCYVTILHTSFAGFTALRDYQQPNGLPAAADVCGYAGEGWSFLRNRDYTDIDRDNCASIGSGPAFVEIGGDAVVTDLAGLREGLILAWTDLVESMAWLLIVFANEAIVRIHRMAPASTRAIAALGRFKAALYVTIIAIAFYWLSKAQVLYWWDEVIWIGGFLCIDRNMVRWRSALPAGLSREPLNAPA